MRQINITLRIVAIAISGGLAVGALLLGGSPSQHAPNDGHATRHAYDAHVPIAVNARPAIITSEQAYSLAVNDLEQTLDGYRLRHPHHTAWFSSEGLRFQPRSGGPQWQWTLTHVGADRRELEGIESGRVTPTGDVPGMVRYARGGLYEQYVLHAHSIEQQFLIPQPLDTDGADLRIAGHVSSGGSFEEHADGWLWRTRSGIVRLGDVTVLDATGERLPARMTASANSTDIVIDGVALAHAEYPVVVDPQIDGDAFRISDMGPNGTHSFKAQDPAIAYNSTDNEYLIVWSGDDDTDALTDDEYEIFGQRIDATTGEPVGTNDFRISSMGPTDGDPAFDAYFPDAAYNSVENEYLVVWVGNDGTGPLGREEFEIFGRRLTAEGLPIGQDDIRISDMGPDGEEAFEAKHPVVAYNSVNNEYLVAWAGEDDTGALRDREFEIFGQRIDAATGHEVGENDFRISDMGASDGDGGHDAITPDIAYNSTNNEFLVVWSGDDDTGALADHENEIFGQRIDGPTGAEVGANDFRISDMGSTDGDAKFDAQTPRIAYNSTNNEYLVIWTGDDDTGLLVDRENEVYGQRIDAATGTEVGENDFRISHMGTRDGDDSYDADDADVIYNSTRNEYLIVWEGIDDSGELIPGEKEIRGQRLDARTGTEVGVDDFRISDMGTEDGDTRFDAYSPSVMYSSGSDEYLVIWEGEDDVPPLVRLEFEVLGQRIDGSTGAEVGTNDFRISDMGPNGNETHAAFESAVAYNSVDHEYLVVWSGDDDVGDLAHGQKEIFGQRIDAGTGLEVGTNDFRISDMGPSGVVRFEARTPAVAFNPVNDEYLVVWSGADNTGSLDEEYEIYGQRLEGATGAEVGANDFRISDMGPDGSGRFAARTPRVVYNSQNHEYLVVWTGNDDGASQNPNEDEIYGQRLDATTGNEVGANDFRISDMGPDGVASLKAREPAVAYNRTSNEYLVVWSGDDVVGLLADNEYEIYGQRLDAASGTEIGTNDFRISDMGTFDGNAAFDASDPDVAHNDRDNQYLVVWSGDDDTGLLVDNESEIHGQRLDASGAQIGPNDFRISDMGEADGNDLFDARTPRVVYNGTKNLYLIVWEGDDDVGVLVDDEKEIFGQRLDAATGHEVGRNDFRISHVGPNGNRQFSAARPAVTYSDLLDSYLVVWEGDDDTGALEEDEFEIFGLWFNDGKEIIPLDERGYSVSRNAPNPFNQKTEFTFVIPEESDVSVRVYNVAGRLIRNLVHVRMDRGLHTATWDARDQNGNTVASGAYYCNITVHGKNGELRYSKTQVLTFLK